MSFAVLCRTFSHCTDSDSNPNNTVQEPGLESESDPDLDPSMEISRKKSGDLNGKCE